MERDFLGINGRDFGIHVKEEARGCPQGSAFFGDPAGHWPFANKISALQQFMSYKAAQEGRHKKNISFNQLPSSGFQPIPTVDAIEANIKSSPMQTQQKCFTFDQQGAHQFAMHQHQPQSTGSSVATCSPFFNLHEGFSYGPSAAVKRKPPTAPIVGSMVGAFAPSSASNPSGQMTIFYAGSVNVYDDVPLDKAQAIMFSASKGSNASPAVVNPRPEIAVLAISNVVRVDGLSMNQTLLRTPTPTPTPTPTLTNNMMPPCSHISSPNSVSSHAGNHNGGGSSTTDDMAVAKSITPLTQQEPSMNVAAPVGSDAPKPVMTRAIPQARKASLALFLEKRKERVTNASPYTKSKKPMESADGLNALSGKQSSTREELWGLGCQSKNITDSRAYLSMKLEM